MTSIEFYDEVIAKIMPKPKGELFPGITYESTFYAGSVILDETFPDRWVVRIFVGGLLAAKVGHEKLPNAVDIALMRTAKRIEKWAKCIEVWETAAGSASGGEP